MDITNSRLTQVLLVLLGLLWSAVMMLGGFAWGTRSAQEALRDMAARQAVMNIQLGQMGQRIDRLHNRLDRIEQIQRDRP